MSINPSRGLIVITGAAGFIGSILALHCARGGYRVAAVDALGCDERWGNLHGVELADFWGREEFLRRILSGRAAALPPIAAIAHLGACSATTETDAGFLMRNNFSYSRALARWCLARDVRMVYASSAATYGDGRAGFSDAMERLPELRPLNAYAFSKHLFDLWAWRHGAFNPAHGIAGLKYFNVYGPNEQHKGAMRSMALKAYEQQARIGRVQLFRSYRPEFSHGEQERDFIYVEDAAAATLWMLEHPAAAGIFNIGSGRPRSWNALAQAVFSALGSVPCIEYVAMPEGMRASYQYSTCADLTRLHAAGFATPARELERGVEEYVRHLQSRQGRAAPSVLN